MKEIFFKTVFLFTLLSCGDDNTKDSLSYTEIGASNIENSKIEPKETVQKDTFQILSLIHI